MSQEPISEDLPARFRAGLEAGRLLLRRCPECGSTHHYPRPHCPHCGHRQTDWTEASGRGILHSFTTGPMLPPRTHYAMVALAEGPVLTTLIVDAGFETLTIGQDVALRVVPGPEGVPVAAFTPCASVDAGRYAARILAEAEREAAGPAPDLQCVAVVGAGTMGQGIVSACLIAGLAAILIDRDPEALVRARAAIGANVATAIDRGKARETTPALLESLICGADMALIAGADIVIEAVYEAMAVKEQVMALIDRHARPGAVLGTNTSTLDIDQIARATGRPGAVVGLHFFSPAHVMKLLEIVRGAASDAQTLAAAQALGRRLGKTAVIVGNAFGFVGNRLMISREHQAAQLLLAGALPHEVDAVLTDFGLPMGTFTLQDMAGGIELAWRQRQDTGRSDWLIDRLYAAGRLGLKAGKGYYRYDPGSRKPLPDPEVEALLREWSAHEGVERRRIDPSEMRDCLILPMVNEGFKLLDEGIAARPEDIDTIWLRGFGWPAWRGGPMYYAEQRGLADILARLEQLEGRHGAAFRPSPRLRALVAGGLSLFAPLTGAPAAREP